MSVSNTRWHPPPREPRDTITSSPESRQVTHLNSNWIDNPDWNVPPPYLRRRRRRSTAAQRDTLEEDGLEEGIPPPFNYYEALRDYGQDTPPHDVWEPYYGRPTNNMVAVVNVASQTNGIHDESESPDEEDVLYGYEFTEDDFDEYDAEEMYAESDEESDDYDQSEEHSDYDRSEEHSEHDDRHLEDRHDSNNDDQREEQGLFDNIQLEEPYDLDDDQLEEYHEHNHDQPEERYEDSPESSPLPPSSPALSETTLSLASDSSHRPPFPRASTPHPHAHPSSSSNNNNEPSREETPYADPFDLTPPPFTDSSPLPTTPTSTEHELSSPSPSPSPSSQAQAQAPAAGTATTPAPSVVVQSPNFYALVNLSPTPPLAATPLFSELYSSPALQQQGQQPPEGSNRAEEGEEGEGGEWGEGSAARRPQQQDEDEEGDEAESPEDEDEDEEDEEEEESEPESESSESPAGWRGATPESVERPVELNDPMMGAPPEMMYGRAARRRRRTGRRRTGKRRRRDSDDGPEGAEDVVGRRE